MNRRILLTLRQHESYRRGWSAQHIWALDPSLDTGPDRTTGVAGTVHTGSILKAWRAPLVIEGAVSHPRARPLRELAERILRACPPDNSPRIECGGRYLLTIQTHRTVMATWCLRVGYPAWHPMSPVVPVWVAHPRPRALGGPSLAHLMSQTPPEWLEMSGSTRHCEPYHTLDALARLVVFP